MPFTNLWVCLQNGAAVNVPNYAPMTQMVTIPQTASVGANVAVVASFVAPDSTV